MVVVGVNGGRGWEQGDKQCRGRDRHRQQRAIDNTRESWLALGRQGQTWVGGALGLDTTEQRRGHVVGGDICECNSGLVMPIIPYAYHWALGYGNEVVHSCSCIAGFTEESHSLHVYRMQLLYFLVTLHYNNFNFNYWQEYCVKGSLIPMIME